MLPASHLNLLLGIQNFPTETLWVSRDQKFEKWAQSPSFITLSMTPEWMTAWHDHNSRRPKISINFAIIFEKLQTKIYAQNSAPPSKDMFGRIFFSNGPVCSFYVCIWTSCLNMLSLGRSVLLPKIGILVKAQAMNANFLKLGCCAFFMTARENLCLKENACRSREN